MAWLGLVNQRGMRLPPPQPLEQETQERRAPGGVHTLMAAWSAGSRRSRAGMVDLTRRMAL